MPRTRFVTINGPHQPKITSKVKTSPLYLLDKTFRRKTVSNLIFSNVPNSKYRSDLECKQNNDRIKGSNTRITCSVQVSWQSLQQTGPMPFVWDASATAHISKPVKTMWKPRIDQNSRSPYVLGAEKWASQGLIERTSSKGRKRRLPGRNIIKSTSFRLVKACWIALFELTPYFQENEPEERHQSAEYLFKEVIAFRVEFSTCDHGHNIQRS